MFVNMPIILVNAYRSLSQHIKCDLTSLVAQWSNYRCVASQTSVNIRAITQYRIVLY